MLTPSYRQCDGGPFATSINDEGDTMTNATNVETKPGARNLGLRERAIDSACRFGYLIHS